MYITAAKAVFHSKRFWEWAIAGAIIYSIPAAIRLATGNVILPVLNWVATPWIGMYIPANLVEKIIVNAFFPGAVGAIGVEVFFSSFYSETLVGRKKFLARLAGALVAVAVWSLIQFVGGLLGAVGTWGGNLFEYPSVFPLNFLLASLSIFTPSVVSFLKDKLSDAYRKFGELDESS
jgi:hypothetical protein